jgi:hypothetical protein
VQGLIWIGAIRTVFAAGRKKRVVFEWLRKSLEDRWRFFSVANREATKNRGWNKLLLHELYTWTEGPPMINLVPMTAISCKAEMSLLITDFLTRSSKGKWTDEELLVAIGDAADKALLDLTD